MYFSIDELVVMVTWPFLYKMVGMLCWSFREAFGRRGKYRQFFYLMLRKVKVTDAHALQI